MKEYKGITQNECDGCVPMTVEHHTLCPACSGHGVLNGETCGLCRGYAIIDCREIAKGLI